MLRIYNKLKVAVRKGCFTDEVTSILTELYIVSLDLLNTAVRLSLISSVPGKKYFSFTKGIYLSRPINELLYNPDIKSWELLLDKIHRDNLDPSDTDLIKSTLYSMAISFCAGVDILKLGDQKTPGTFFEYFIAYFYTWRVGVNPQNSIQILSLDGENISLPTDYIFNLGKDKQKFHMPIKTSSRERSIMLWAHQKLLNGIYGDGRFMGTPVLLAETKLDKKTKVVVEICLPSQWRLYQLYISKLTRIYYLDMPVAYRHLNTQFPPIAVRDFSDFFFEWNSLIPS